MSSLHKLAERKQALLASNENAIAIFIEGIIPQIEEHIEDVSDDDLLTKEYFQVRLLSSIFSMLARKTNRSFESVLDIAADILAKHFNVGVTYKVSNSSNYLNTNKALGGIGLTKNVDFFLRIPV